MYKRHDLDVELEFPLSGTAILERFAADRIDIGDMNVLSIALKIESGKDYVIIAPGANYDSSVPTTKTVFTGGILGTTMLNARVLKGGQTLPMRRRKKRRAISSGVLADEWF
jgi:hypothetical protein